MSQDERFDVLDEGGQVIGTATRAEVHAQGLWHRTFQCWIWGRDAGGVFVLFQLRHPEKDTFPGLLDITCAGHLLSGETPEDGVRELQEELGVDVPFHSLTPCGVYAEEDRLSGGVIDREQCHLFALERAEPLSSYRLQPEEVSGLYRVMLHDVHRMLEGESVPAAGVLLQPDGTLLACERLLRPADFVPHAADCYSLLFQAVGAAVTEAAPAPHK
ncbi:NUDIX domain-containing protein [Paenibacillus chartarius]|uniref:NUDIX domain-containing protein n=1 Tax=Paenibacillus chartarius TaxID=747481 RepID=A0ABV6DQM3_9BACL